jgi:predicted alpha/beta hydrolase
MQNDSEAPGANEEDVVIDAADGQKLTGTLYLPAGEPRAAIQINGGVGVKRRFYRHFAAYLTSRGYAVLTFDFRGTGGSRPKSLRGYRATLSDWGTKDIPAAFDWLSNRYLDVPKFIVGHSMGGQITGLMHNHEQVSGIVLVFVATGYFRTFPMPFRLYPMFILYLFFPLMTPLFGYAPARFVTPGQDLPSGVAWEWIDWTRQSKYMKRRLGNRVDAFHFPRLTAPVHAFVVDDDPMATPENARRFLDEYYSNTKTELTQLHASDAPHGKVGHLGYFRKGLADAYWSKVGDWLDARISDTKSAAAAE